MSAPPRWIVPLTQLNVDEEEEHAVAAVIRRRWLSMGEEVIAFEREFAKALDVPHAIAFTNGTAALRVAYEVADLKPGDAIALPSLTFVACLNVALRLGLEPHLMDIVSEDDLTASQESLEALHQRVPNMRAVVSMPFGGFTQNMAALSEWCGKRGITLIEDSCHGLLSSRGGRMIGTFGQTGTFSFFPNKNMTSGEGGMLTTHDDAVAHRARRIRSHGMTAMTLERHKGQATGYDVELAGENYRMDELRAAMGRVQLRKLNAANAGRRLLSRRIVDAITERTGGRACFPFWSACNRPPTELSACHLLMLLLPDDWDREDFRATLAAEGVQTSVHYPPMQRFSHVRDRLLPQEQYLPTLLKVMDRLVTMPLAPNFSDEQVDHLVAVTGRAFDSMSD